MKLSLYTRPNRLTDLHRLIDSARKNSTQIKVTREDLIGLLMDHSNLVDRVGLSNVEFQSKTNNGVVA